MEPQSRVSDRSRSPQRKEIPQKSEGEKSMAEVKKPSVCQRQRSISPCTRTKTMMYLKTNLERPQPRSLQYQHFLSSQDHLPVHKIHRPVPSLPVHKDHRPVPSLPVPKDHRPVPTLPVPKEHLPEPALRMYPLTTTTSTEKENLAQQYKVHEVMTQEGQCFTQTFMF